MPLYRVRTTTSSTDGAGSVSTRISPRPEATIQNDRVSSTMRAEVQCHNFRRTMIRVSNPAERWHWVALAAALLLLDASITFSNIWPTPAVRWGGQLSVELSVCLLAMAVASRRFGPPSRAAVRGLAALWLRLVIGRYADVAAPALYGREINLYWDARHVSAVSAMLARAASSWLALGAAPPPVPP